MQPPPTPPDSTPAEIDAALADLQAHATEWARLPIPAKVELLDTIRPRIADVAGRWVTAASRAKGLAVGSPLRAEEWTSGPWAVANYVGALAETLRHLENGTVAEALAGRVRQRPDAQAVVRVLPAGLTDRVLLSGVEADVWMQPGVAAADVPKTVGRFYQEEDPEGRVALVLGAGNIAAIPALDVLYRLFAEGEVVLLKMNPVNGYLQPLFETVFGAFVEAGYLRFAAGGADVGRYLTDHEAVDAIHMTGSAATHDAIVYGTGAEGERRKAADEPRISVPVSSELGGVSPCLVVPGDWSEPDLVFQAEHVASQKLHNSGFNCISSQVLVMADGWRQRGAFLGELRRVLAAVEDRPAYYPGAADRLDTFAEAYPHADRFGHHGQRLLATVSPEAGEPAFEEEVFGPALAVTDLPGGDDPADWLDRAVDWCNTTLEGTLGATILIHPRTRKAMGARFEDAIAQLRYGTIGVNVWSGAGFFVAQGSWGAFPGHTRDDVQSGIGVVHNSWLFERPQKTVLSGPFAPFPRSLLLGETHTAPTPLYFVTNETAETTARRVTEFATAPSPTKLPAIVASALRG
jgi:aldehyde dehydrogenase (NAD(P)+)